MLGRAAGVGRETGCFPGTWRPEWEDQRFSRSAKEAWDVTRWSRPLLGHWPRSTKRVLYPPPPQASQNLAQQPLGLPSTWASLFQKTPSTPVPKVPSGSGSRGETGCNTHPSILVTGCYRESGQLLSFHLATHRVPVCTQGRSRGRGPCCPGGSPVLGDRSWGCASSTIQSWIRCSASSPLHRNGEEN